jgi:hypothetical protein
MGQYDVYLEWNAFQELRIKVTHLVTTLETSQIEQELSEILLPPKSVEELNESVFKAYLLLKRYSWLIDSYNDLLEAEGLTNFRYVGVSGQSLPPRPGYFMYVLKRDVIFPNSNYTMGNR